MRDKAEKRFSRLENRPAELAGGRAGITVVTWNIHSCVGLDARFSPERVAEVLTTLDADIIGLQEVGWHHRGETGLDQFRFLAEATGRNLATAPTKNGRNGHFGNALLSRFPIVEQTPFDLTLPGKEPRTGVDAIVDAHGREVRVMVVHLGLTPWERARQYDQLASRHEARAHLPTLVMGDFNEWAVQPRRLVRLARRFTHHAHPPSFPASLPTLRLDRVLVGGGLRLESCTAPRLVPTFRASDHLPVVGRVTLPAAERGGD